MGFRSQFSRLNCIEKGKIIVKTREEKSFVVSGNKKTTAVDKKGYAWRVSNPGRVLINALQRFEARVLELMEQAGFADTRRSHINMTRHLELEGTRVTDLARRATMTNAAMTELINQCVALSLVERVSDPNDGRVRI